MATTLTNPIATVTLAGTAERITLPSTYSWIWVRNDTDAAVYISQADDVGEGVSGSVAVPAGGAARLALTGDSFYAVGTGSVQVVAANYTDCPFKTAPAVSGGGSESGGNGMTLIGTFDVDSASWTNIGTIEAGTRLLLESVNTRGQASTSPNVGTMVGYTVVPESNKYQSLYLKVMMMYPATSVVEYVLLSVNTNGMIALSAHSTATTAVYNVYKLEVPTA